MKMRQYSKNRKAFGILALPKKRCLHCGDPIQDGSYCGYCQVVVWGKREDDWPPIADFPKKREWERMADL
jgi:hypothetical protein